MNSIYPVKNMNIMQGYNGAMSSHVPNVTGSPFDFPWDEAGENTGRDWFIPSTDFIVKRIYGVGAKGDNTIWLESTEPVEMPIGKDYLTLMVIHPEDEDLKKYKVMDIIKAGTLAFREGKDGTATGNHFHISAGTGKFAGNGWVQNNKGAYVLTTTGKRIKPEEAFFIAPDIKIINSRGYKFKEVKKLTKSEAKAIVKEKAGLSDATIQYIADDYRYGDEAIVKLAEAMQQK